jgi:hypothetical protein
VNPLDLLDAMTPVVEALEALGVSYHIGGSVASSVHGVGRATADADLVADLRVEHVQPLVTMLEVAYFVQSEAIEEAITQRSSFNVIHLDTMIKVDIFVPPPQPFEQEVQRRAVQDTLDAEERGRRFHLASPEDTILHKLRWYRRGGEVSERQWNDVLGILLVQAGYLDLNYLWRWADQLGVRDLLERALAAIGGEHVDG